MKVNLSKETALKLNFIYALFKKPVYINCDYLEDGTVKPAKDFKSVIKVAVVGFNESGQTFLDTLLQVGQMPGRLLDVTVYYSPDEAGEKKAYLDSRPAFTEFFDVDDIHSEDSYGHITFRKSRWKDKGNTTVEFFDELSSMDYVLYAEEKEGSVINKVGAVLKENALPETPFLIKAHYSEDMTDFTDKNEFAEFERMAFNAHLVWKYSLEIDFAKAKKEFRNEYNYISSLSYVLSIKYKLHSCGIEFDLNNITYAAEKFLGFVNASENDSKRNKALIDKLAAAEHRRWNAEKICTGWQRVELEDININDDHNKGKLDGKFKNHHYCLAKSNADNPLASWSADDWDKKSVNDLDELDKVSVITHRVLLEAADEAFKGENSLSNRTADIENMLNINPDSKSSAGRNSEYLDWKACVELILQSNAKKICKPYSNAYDRLIKKVKDNEAVRTEIMKINEAVKVLIKSREPDNQKDKDYYLVKQIPFILLYKDNLKLACEFAYGDNSKLFANVSVLKKFNPAEIIYFCEYADSLEEDIKHFTACINDYKWLRTRISFVFGFSSKSENKKIEKLAEMYNIHAEKYPYDEYYDYISGIGESNISTGVHAVIFNNKTLGYNLRKASVPCGYYLSSECEFTSPGDTLLRSVKFDIAMTIQDILRINGARGAKDSVPVSFEKVYPVYRDNKLAWKTLCKWLFDNDFFYKDNKNQCVFNVDKSRRDNLKKKIKESAGNSFYFRKNVDQTEINAKKEELTASFFNMLNLLEEKGICSLTYSGDNELEKIKFNSLQNKSLFDQEGKILESHIYNLCVFSGLFDDIATGYEIEWEKDEDNKTVCNEFDLLLVKGLKSAFIEIKATADVTGSTGLRQEYYEKLEALDCKFGINSYEFIINDSVEMLEFTNKEGIKYRSYIDGNKIQISRGRKFGIKTILPRDNLERTAGIIDEEMRKKRSS